MFDTAWYRDPAVLVMRPLEFFPTRDMTHAERLNSVVRFIMYASGAIALYKNELMPLFVGGVVIVILSMIFSVPTNDTATISPIVARTNMTARHSCTPPTPNNPFMNTLANEFGKEKPGACAVTTETLRQSQDFFDRDLPREVSDVYHNRASDRQFVTMPASATNGVPDTVAFRNFLFSETVKGPKCKTT